MKKVMKQGKELKDEKKEELKPPVNEPVSGDP
jgi:hypothetical protein